MPKQFRITPSHIIFDDYKKDIKYERIINIINQTGELHQINWNFVSNPEIKIKCFGDQRLASGLSIILKIYFTPKISKHNSMVDQRFEIKIFCSKAGFEDVIPILVVSNKPQINFPTEINMPETSPNIPSYFPIFIFNIGLQPSSISFTSNLDSEKGMIAVIPSSIKLDPSEDHTFIVELIPKICGKFEENLILEFNDGRLGFIKLRCVSKRCSVFIETNLIEFSNIYFGMRATKSFNLINESDKKIDFEWCKIVDSEAFEIIPRAGEVYPDSDVPIVVVFRYPEIPDCMEGSIEFKENFKLKISTEINKNIQLRVVGEVIAPTILLNLKKVSIEDIFLGEKYQFEVICYNPGKFSGRIQFNEFISSFGGRITSTPEYHLIEPQNYQRFIIEYSTTKLGKFIEEIFFQIKCGIKHSIILTGYVKPLNVKISPKIINFGQVPICIPIFEYIRFENPIKSRLEIMFEIKKNGEDDPLVFYDLSSKKFENFDLEDIEVEDSVGDDLRYVSEIGSCDDILNNLNFGVRNSPIKRIDFPTTNFEEKIIKEFKPFDLLSEIGSCDDILNVKKIESDRTLFVKEGINLIFNKTDSYFERDQEVKDVVEMVFQKIDSFLEATDVIGFVIENIIDSYWTEMKVQAKKFADQGMELFMENLDNFIEEIFTRDQSVNTGIDTIFEKLTDLMIFKDNEKYLFKDEGLNLMLKGVNEISEKEDEIKNCFDQMYEKIDNFFIGTSVMELILDDILDDLINGDFIEELKYFQKDWIFSENSLEFDVKPGKIILEPKQSVSILLTLIPNFRGNNLNNLKIFIRYYDELEPFDKINCTEMNVPLKHFCVVPDFLLSKNEFEIESFVEISTKFTFTIKNITNVDGFCFFKEKLFADGLIEFNPTKMYIKANDSKLVVVKFTPQLSGEILYKNKIQALGDVYKINSFQIKCLSNPPLVDIFPRRVELELKCLEPNLTRIFITNVSPTIARFIVFLDKQNENIDVYPKGGILGPSQSIVVLISSLFYDPVEIIRNSLHVQIKHGENMKIPLRISVTGHPLIFNPNIDSLIDFGSSFVLKQLIEIPISVENRGKALYTLFFTAKNKLSIFKFDPSSIEIGPSDKKHFKVSTIPSKIMLRQDVFLIDVVMEKSSRKLLFETSVRINVVNPSLKWSKNHVEFDVLYGQNSMIWDEISVKNNGKLPVELFTRTEGDYFFIKLSEEKDTIFCYEIVLTIEPKATKSIIVHFNQNLIKEFNENVQIVGRLVSKVFDKIQTPIPLITNLIYPSIKLSENCIFIYSTKIAVKTFEILNTGPIEVFFKLCFKYGSFRMQEILGDAEVLEELIISDDDEYFETKKNNTSREKFDEEVIEPIIESFTDLNNVFGRGVDITSYISFDKFSGIIEPFNSQLIKLEFNPKENNFEYKVDIEVLVEGGLKSELQFNGFNCEPTVEISKTSFELGFLPWYKRVIKEVLITNTCPIPLSIELCEYESNPSLTGEATVKILTKNQFLLKEKKSHQNIKFEIFPGIIGFFTKKFIIKINDFEFTEILFSGTSVLPQINVFDIGRKFKIDPLLEYEILRRMFNEDESKEQDLLEDLEISNNLSTEDTFCKICDKKYEQTIPKNRILKKIVSKTDFSVIDFNSNNVPCSNKISKYLIQEYFVKSINSPKISQKQFNKFVEKCIKEKPKIPRVQVLPFVEPALFVVDLGEVEINESVQLILNCSYNGPGKLKASIRTDAPIPDLRINFGQEDFCQCNTTEKKPTKYTFNEFTPTFEKSYVNKNERNNESKISIRKTHSYDFNSYSIHTRNVETIEKQAVNDYYTALSVKFRDQRDPNTYSEIHQSNNSNTIDGKFLIKIEFSPTEKCYRDCTEFDDIFYVDVNFGTTIPFNLKGTILQSQHNISFRTSKE